ncbi:MAG: hypothetical protein RI949_3013 [Pseudomonadota bacterium]
MGALHASTGLARSRWLSRDNPGMTEQRLRPSLTVAGIIERNGLYLLVEEQTPEGLRLNNPAGHLEQGETLIEAVIREVLEETAHPFVPEALVGVYLSRFQRPAAQQDVTYVRMAFCGTVSAPLSDRALDCGIVRTLWLSLDDVRASQARHRSPLVLQCIEDHHAGQRHPLSLLHAHESLKIPEIKG